MQGNWFQIVKDCTYSEKERSVGGEKSSFPAIHPNSQYNKGLRAKAEEDEACGRIFVA